MTNQIKKVLCIVFFFSACYQADAQIDSTTYFQIKKIVDDTKATYAPDQRTKLVELAKADVASNQYLIQTTEKQAKVQLDTQLAKINSVLSIKLLPDESVADKIYGVINLSVANLRTRPSHAAEMATQVLLGTQVDILQKAGGDYRVRTPEGYIAWIPTSSLVAFNKTEMAAWKANKQLIYTDEFGRSYSQPDEKSQRISDMVYGNILSVIGEENGFYKVAYPDQRIAYINKNQAVSFDEWINTRKATPDNILKSARTMLGLPYLWGGTSVKGVDCSGFTKTSFYMNGIIIPRDASQQVLYGEAVDILDKAGSFDTDKALKNLKPADLLFFAAGKNSNPNARVTHVALYIGNGEFIHAAGTVRVNSLLQAAENYDDFQTRTAVAARRYVGSKDTAIQKIEKNRYYSKNNP